MVSFMKTELIFDMVVAESCSQHTFWAWFLTFYYFDIIWNERWMVMCTSSRNVRLLLYKRDCPKMGLCSIEKKLVSVIYESIFVSQKVKMNQIPLWRLVTDVLVQNNICIFCEQMPADDADSELLAGQSDSLVKLEQMCSPCDLLFRCLKKRTGSRELALLGLIWSLWAHHHEPLQLTTAEPWELSFAVVDGV